MKCDICRNPNVSKLHVVFTMMDFTFYEACNFCSKKEGVLELKVESGKLIGTNGFWGPVYKYELSNGETILYVGSKDKKSFGGYVRLKNLKEEYSL